MNKHNITNDNFFTCTFPNCNKKYKTNRRYKEHIQLHENPDIYSCKIPNCGKTYESKFRYSEHKKLHQSPDIFSCNIPMCNKKFAIKETYKRHMKKHIEHNDIFYIDYNINPYQYQSPYVYFPYE